MRTAEQTIQEIRTEMIQLEVDIKEMQQYLKQSSGYEDSDFFSDVIDEHDPISLLNYERGTMRGLQIALDILRGL